MADIPDPKSKPKFSFKANFAINMPILFATLGLLYGIIVFNGPGLNSDGHFHDLYFSNKRLLADSIITARINFIKGKINLFGKYENDFSTVDSIKIKRETLVKAKEALLQSQAEQSKLRHFNADTSLQYFTRYFSTDRDQYLIALTRNDHSVAVFTRDTFSIQGETLPMRKENLKIDRNNSIGLLNYFDKYSQFGVWFFVSITQTALWFLVFCLVIGAAGKTNFIVTEFPYNFKNALTLVLIPIIVMGLFAFALYWKLIGTFVISDYYFMDGFNNRMYWYSIPGYIITVICFGIYLFLANKMEMLNTDATQKKLKIDADDELKKKYLTLESAFDFTFLCTSVILSVFVLWLGTLFNAVNNLEAIHFYTFLSGKPVLNYDFVYLMGLMHTLLLLIFYIPVRLQFKSLQLTKDQNNAVNANNPKKVLKTFWDAAGTILITASPIITTIVQKLITGFLSN
jgi:hypothetical protein